MSNLFFRIRRTDMYTEVRQKLYFRVRKMSMCRVSRLVTNISAFPAILSIP